MQPLSGCLSEFWKLRNLREAMVMSKKNQAELPLNPQHAGILQSTEVNMVPSR